MNEIIIEGLELATHIGVPDAERTLAQVLRADIVMRPKLAFADMQDEIAQTIDYEAVANHVRALAAARPRRLIETLANEIADAVIHNFGASSVIVTLRKRILPGTDAVAVRMERN